MKFQLRAIMLLLFFGGVLVTVSECGKSAKPDPRGPEYAGSQTCMSCHKDVGNSYTHNSHFKTSRLMYTGTSTDSVGLPVGKFVFNEKTRVSVEKRADGLYQVAYVNDNNVKEARTDIVFGSGKKAYTLAFWDSTRLRQLPLNYLPKEHLWVNSPGFPKSQIYFGRQLALRCLECHASFAQKIPPQAGNFNLDDELYRNSVVLSIDCERCHGPAAKHVRYQQEHPEDKKAHFMEAFNKLSKNAKMSMCGLCHSGANLQIVTSPFFFKPGDDVSNMPDYSTFIGQDFDVHGKQKQLLMASQCYIKSNMDCTTCHNTHQEQNLSLIAYSQKCIGCHKTVQHQTLAKAQQAMLQNNCINCHMPVKVSRDIGFQLSNSKDMLPYKLRTHRIAVYLDENTAH